MKNDVKIEVNLSRLGLSSDKGQPDPGKAGFVADMPEVWGVDRCLSIGGKAEIERFS